MTSLWLHGARHRAEIYDGATNDVSNAEVIVVGAGITGMVTAVLLARAGKRVVVVEARTAGAVTTGNTTAKVSLLQGSRLSTISRRHSIELVRDYVDGNREGQAWLARYCAERAVDLQREDAYSFAQFERGLPTARAEFEAAQAAGLAVDWVEGLDVPFDFRGGVRLPEQIQFDPMAFLAALITELYERGGRLVTGQRVHAASTAGGRVRLKLRDSAEREQIAHADQCVLATGTPILDRGGFFARLHPARSYCVAFDVAGELPRPMMLSVDQPTRSVRYAPTADGQKLIVGGGGHTVGRKDGARTSYDELVGWTKRHYPGAQPTHYWSAQDYVPIDELPYVGPLLPGDDHFFVATGFAKWGMTNGVAAGLLLAKRLLGGEQAPWARAFASWSPHELTGLTTALKINLEVGWQMASGWVTPVAHRDGELREGAGSVTGPPWHMVARSVVDGVERCVSPVCTHLGGILAWNDAEKSWDCPLHGSRFAADGAVLEGPAARALSR